MAEVDKFIEIKENYFVEGLSRMVNINTQFSGRDDVGNVIKLGIKKGTTS
jgi:hypothetical protein